MRAACLLNLRKLRNPSAVFCDQSSTLGLPIMGRVELYPELYPVTKKAHEQLLCSRASRALFPSVEPNGC
jgi:hypothetical protein